MSTSIFCLAPTRFLELRGAANCLSVAQKSTLVSFCDWGSGVVLPSWQRFYHCASTCWVHSPKGKFEYDWPAASARSSRRKRHPQAANRLLSRRSEHKCCDGRFSVLTDNKLKWGLFSIWHWQPKCCKSRRWSTPRNTSNEFGFISLQGTFISLKLVKPLQHQLISRYQFQSLHEKSLTWQ